MTHATCFVIKPPPRTPRALVSPPRFSFFPCSHVVFRGHGRGGGVVDFLIMSHHFTSGLSKEACFFVEFIAVASVKVSYIQASN